MKTKMKGGSKASDLVMESKPVLCDKSSVVNIGPKMDFDVSKLSLYKTSGGGRRKSKSKKRKSKKSKKSKKRKSKKRGGGKTHPHTGRNNGCGADCKGQSGGSAWKATLYSRGPVNQPSNPKQFRMFTQTRDFIPNESLRSATFMRGSGNRKSLKRSNKRNKRNKRNNRKSNNRKRNKRCN